MKKNIVLSIFVLIVGSICYLLSLMQIYASPDGNSYPLNGSLIYLGMSILLFSFLFNTTSDITTLVKWFNILIVSILGIFGLLLALICIYASPVENMIFPLASAIFALSATITFSGIFFIGQR